MSLVHDLAEALVGDITPDDNVSDEDKHAQEKHAFEHMCNLVAQHCTGKTDSDSLEISSAVAEIFELWNEYETQSTIEAKLVKDIDKFDMILQADEYEQAQDKQLDTFFKGTVEKIQHPFMQSLTTELTQQRTARQQQQQQQ